MSGALDFIAAIFLANVAFLLVLLILHLALRGPRRTKTMLTRLTRRSTRSVRPVKVVFPPPPPPMLPAATAPQQRRADPARARELARAFASMASPPADMPAKIFAEAHDEFGEDFHTGITTTAIPLVRRDER